MLLGLLSFEFGDYLTAQTHLLAAAQLARQVGDHTLAGWVRINQSTVALWAGDFRAALDYARTASATRPEPCPPGWPSVERRASTRG